MNKEQIFIHHSIYPKAADIFAMEVRPIDEISQECIYVFDTNALLIPYSTSSSSFEEIKKAFAKLIEKQQLVIPSQVAREFAKNRPEKIKTLFQQLSRTREKIQNLSTGQYPLLATLKEYHEAVEIEKEIQISQKKYSKKIDEILTHIRKWRWNDPVSSVYNKLFNEKVIYELEIIEEEVLKELEKRNKYNIPPGFKDKSKEDLGVGDLLIWLTILEIAKKRKKDVIFISGDEKNDWFHRSENQSLYPRFELISEFKNASEGKSFHIIKLSELLNILGANKDAVEEIETTERFTYSSIRSFSLKAEELIRKWVKDTEPGKEIIYNRGYPNFTIKHEDYAEGVDIMVIQKSRGIILTHRLKERFMRAYFEINERNFYCFRIFVVFTSSEDVENSLKALNRFSEEHRNEFISIFPGIIDEEGYFKIL